MTTTFEHGDFLAFQQWHDRQPIRHGDTHNPIVECVHHSTEFGVMEGRGRSTINPTEFGWFQLLKTFRDLDRANEYAKKEPRRFVVQRRVYCEAWQ